MLCKDLICLDRAKNCKKDILPQSRAGGGVKEGVGEETGHCYASVCLQRIVGPSLSH